MNRYALRDNDLMLDSAKVEHAPSVKQYILKIRDMDTDERPREKLLSHGPGVLSASELIAIILNTGTKKEDVMSMASRVVREYGERTLIGHTNAARLSEDLDIPLTKAMQIVACSELGRRFFKKRDGGAAIVRTAQDVYTHVGDMKYLTKEHLRGLYLNVHYQIIHDEVLSIGTVSSNLIHPREVFRPAIEYSAAGVILVHNHPSGISEPSTVDIDITRQLINAGKIIGINLIDHVIVTHNAFTSIELPYA